MQQSKQVKWEVWDGDPIEGRLKGTYITKKLAMADWYYAPLQLWWVEKNGDSWGFECVTSDDAS